MHILFVDESGTPPPPAKIGSAKYFVLAGIIIPEVFWHRVRDRVLGLKLRLQIRGEIKWRYFSPTNEDIRNPLRHLPQEERNSVRKNLYKIICGEPSIKTLACVCSVASAYEQKNIESSDDIYHLAYKVITERFQYYLQDLSRIAGRKEFGIVVGDHRARKEDKLLRLHHNRLLYSQANHTSNYENLIESLFLQPSHLSIGIQLADLVAGAVWRKFEREDDQWYVLMESSLRRSSLGEVDGFGLIKSPKKTWQ